MTVKLMKKILSKCFLLTLCFLGLNGCTALAVGTLAAGLGLAVISDGCPTGGCGRSPYRSKDGKHNFNNSDETDWYDSLSQSEKDLLNKNSDICFKKWQNGQKKGVEIDTGICHIELGSPCYKRKGYYIYNQCCRLDNNECN